MNEYKLHDCAQELDARNANLSFSRFEDVRLSASTFRDAALADSRFERVQLDGCVFDKVSLVNVQITQGRYDGMTIDGIEVLKLLEAYRAQQSAAATR